MSEMAAYLKASSGKHIKVCLVQGVVTGKLVSADEYLNLLLADCVDWTGRPLSNMMIRGNNVKYLSRVD